MKQQIKQRELAKSYLQSHEPLFCNSDPPEKSAVFIIATRGHNHIKLFPLLLFNSEQTVIWGYISVNVLTHDWCYQYVIPITILSLYTGGHAHFTHSPI